MSVAFTNLPAKATLRPTPFSVSIPQAKLDELQTLLIYSKLAPDTYEGSQDDRKYGVTNKWIRDAKYVWEKEFDWRKHEEHINLFPHYIAPIVDDGIEYKIHFVAMFSDKPDAVPLVLLHGWPGSFLEFLPILSIIYKKYDASTLPYHLIVPSMPGYTFSSPPPMDRDLRIEDVARIFDKLVVGLGFTDGYVVQGGDIGSKVGRIMAAEHASCKAVHLNYCAMPEPVGTSRTLSQVEQKGLVRMTEFMRFGCGYAIEQATKPSTIGIVLSSSPLALLAWIGEKFLDWTDEDPSLDIVLESVTLYWLTDTISRSIYSYRQVSRQLFEPGSIGVHENPVWHIHKPLGYSWFPQEIAPMPRSWIETTGNLVFFRRHTKGGHFAAIEQSAVLLKDVEDFIAQVWK